MEIITYWISLNRTEKNSRDIIENLVLQTEHLINEESNKWNSTGDAKKVKEDKNGEEEKDIK